MRIAVIGATGYIGATISERLASAGHEIVAWGRRRAPGHESWALPFEDFFVGDVQDEAVLGNIVACGADAWIYCVSLDHHDSERDVDRALRINVAPVWRLLDGLNNGDQRQPRRFLYLSTSQVYGSFAGSVSEASPVWPRNHYSLTHVMAENVTARYHRPPGLYSLSLRLANGYGAPRFPDANCWWLVVNDLCRSAFTVGEIRLKSDGTPQRDFVHTRDIAHAARMLIEAPVETIRYPVYNVGSGETHTILDAANTVAEIYARKFKKQISVLLPQAQIMKGDQEQVGCEPYHYDIDRLTDIGFGATTDLTQGVEEMFDYLMEQGSKS